MIIKETIQYTCQQLAVVAAVVVVREPAVAVEVGLELCWHFGFVREFVVSLNNI